MIKFLIFLAIFILIVILLCCAWNFIVPTDLSWMDKGTSSAGMCFSALALFFFAALLNSEL